MLFKSILITLIASLTTVCFGAEEISRELKAGIIGLDTSHSIAFTKSLNQGPKNPAFAEGLSGVRVVAAYAQGSKTIESSVKRVPEYIREMEKLGVPLVDTIEDLLEKVDVVFLESNDGQVHLEQLQPIFKAKKPVFVDKPLASNLVDCVKIFEQARASGTPIFSSSGLRFGQKTIEARKGALGNITEVMAYSPATIEPSHPDLFWYGIHGVESLFTVLGKGILTVKRGTSEDGLIQVVGQWSGGKTGIYLEANQSDRKGYGGLAKGEKGEMPIGAFDGYDPMLVEIVSFFKTGKAPVSPEETLEIYAFMEAADESKRQGGKEISVKDVLDRARDAAK